MSKEKLIGMIGGASWESTVLYYKLINEMVREQLGSLNSAKILLYSINYDPIVKLEKEGRWEEVGKFISRAAKTLENGGASFILLCCNTLHKITPFIERAISIPFLHIADAAGTVLLENNIRKIGLLGTQFTMEDGFYSSRLENKFGLEVIVPKLSDRRLLDNIIYNELCQGKIFQKSKNELIRILQDFKKAKAEAVLLGCTELGMLIQKSDVSVDIYDTTILHAEEAVKRSLEKMKENILAL